LRIGPRLLVIEDSSPDPRQLVYVVLLALSAIEAFILASLRPHVNVPAQASRAMVRVTPVTVAT
jgi:hypothetical protein